MLDIFKALLIGGALIAVVVAAAVVSAIVIPFLGFALIVLVIWFVIQLCKDEESGNGR